MKKLFIGIATLASAIAISGSLVAAGVHDEYRSGGRPLRDVYIEVRSTMDKELSELLTESEIAPNVVKATIQRTLFVKGVEVTFSDDSGIQLGHSIDIQFSRQDAENEELTIQALIPVDGTQLKVLLEYGISFYDTWNLDPCSSHIIDYSHYQKGEEVGEASVKYMEMPKRSVVLGLKAALKIYDRDAVASGGGGGGGGGSAAAAAAAATGGGGGGGGGGSGSAR